MYPTAYVRVSIHESQCIFLSTDDCSTADIALALKKCEIRVPDEYLQQSTSPGEKCFAGLFDK